MKVLTALIAAGLSLLACQAEHREEAATVKGVDESNNSNNDVELQSCSYNEGSRRSLSGLVDAEVRLKQKEARDKDYQMNAHINDLKDDGLVTVGYADMLIPVKEKLLNDNKLLARWKAGVLLVEALREERERAWGYWEAVQWCYDELIEQVKGKTATEFFTNDKTVQEAADVVIKPFTAAEVFTNDKTVQEAADAFIKPFNKMMEESKGVINALIRARERDRDDNLIPHGNKMPRLTLELLDQYPNFYINVLRAPAEIAPLEGRIDGANKFSSWVGPCQIYDLLVANEEAADQ